MIVLDCSVGEGGGGILRAALPISLAMKIPIRFTQFRIERAEPGIGWPHKWLIDAICYWTNSRANPVNLGETDFIFEPGALDFKKKLTLNYDDPNVTIENKNIIVFRKYSAASDHFPQPMNNINGKAIRGHSISTPLVALLPLLLLRQDIATAAELIGGTETPGAPFIDALNMLLIKTLNRMGAFLSLEVVSRGCIGIGGGLVKIYAQPFSELIPFKEKVERESSISMDVVLYVYGTNEYFEKTCMEYDHFVEALASDIGYPIAARRLFIPYPVRRYQQLFFIKNKTNFRDISICYEEISESERENFGLSLVTRRLKEELQNSHLTSRFLVEQLVPVAAIIPGISEFYTERITPHLKSVIDIVKVLTGRNIQIEYVDPAQVKLVV